MDELKFKTNIRCTGCLGKAGPALDAVAGQGSWTVDLEHPDRTLTVRHAGVRSAAIKKALRKAGYSAEPLN